ncbi:hypothetical protein HUU40_07190, partial [candidate division KSB1 bacterium]|nr:hypothetical protein [candidate division KSB1 bacterium]
MKALYLNIAVVFILACAGNFVAGSSVAAQTQEAEAESLQTQPFDNAPVITSLVITGNRHTKHHIILREIQVKVGDVLDPEVLEADRKRLLNLRLFSHVEIDGIPVEDGVQLIITVYESWYIYPYPIFFMNDRDWD